MTGYGSSDYIAKSITLAQRFEENPSIRSGVTLINHTFRDLPRFAKSQAEYFKKLVADGMNPIDAFNKVDKEFVESVTASLARFRLIARDEKGDLKL